MLISFFSKNRLSFWKNRFFFDYRIWASLSPYAVGYYVTCRTPCSTHRVIAISHRRQQLPFCWRLAVWAQADGLAPRRSVGSRARLSL